MNCWQNCTIITFTSTARFQILAFYNPFTVSEIAIPGIYQHLSLSILQFCRILIYYKMKLTQSFSQYHSREARPRSTIAQLDLPSAKHHETPIHGSLGLAWEDFDYQSTLVLGKSKSVFLVYKKTTRKRYLLHSCKLQE
jgi:hypothetical protein